MTSANTDTTGAARVAVIGGGAIGGLLAAAAEEAGHEVTLCVRTAIPQLVVERNGTARRVPVRIAEQAAGLSAADWLLLATKAQDTAAAAPWLHQLVGPATRVVVLQNGIEHEARVRPLVGTAPVVPALVYAGAERIAPGHIVYHQGNRVVVPQGRDGEAFAALLAGSWLTIVQAADFTTAAWRKLMSNITANPLTALTLRRMTVFRRPAMDELARGLLSEAAAVGRAAGADVSLQDADAILRSYAAHAEDAGTSMLYDRLAGRPLEHDYLTGAVVREADRLGIPVPLNRAILALLEAIDDGH